jgi:hypothetical protein
MDPILIASRFARIVTKLLLEDIVDPFLPNVGATTSLLFFPSGTIS